MTEGVYDILLTDGIKHIFLSNEGMHDIPLIDKHIFRVCEGGEGGKGGGEVWVRNTKAKFEWSALRKE
jgi:hypothetical protein